MTRMGDREKRLSMRWPRSMKPVYLSETSAICVGGDDGDCSAVVAVAAVDDGCDDVDDEISLRLLLLLLLLLLSLLKVELKPRRRRTNKQTNKVRQRG